MEKYSPISSQQIIANLSELKDKFTRLETQLNNKEEWFKRFQESLEQQSGKLEELRELLEKERDNRTQGIGSLEQIIERESQERSSAEKEFREDLKSTTKSAYKLAGVIGAVGAVLIPLLIGLTVLLVQAITNSGSN